MAAEETMRAFLVFEGLDGSGKSTLIERLAAELKARGRDLILTREPGGTPLAEDIRGILLRTDVEAPCDRAELLLYEASRAQHVDRVIKPALARGQWVLCDRFAASTVAFQSFARRLARAEVDWLNAYAIAGADPDLYVLLDLPVEESFRRRAHRNLGQGVDDDRFEREAREFHEAVRLGYLTQAREAPRNWLVLDAAQSPEALFEDLLKNLEGRGWLAKS